MTTLILIQKASEGQQSAAHLWYIMNLDQSQHKGNACKEHSVSY